MIVVMLSSVEVSMRPLWRCLMSGPSGYIGMERIEGSMVVGNGVRVRNEPSKVRRVRFPNEMFVKKRFCSSIQVLT
jgi:hypothetical protein